MSVQWADNFGRYGTGGGSNTPMRDGLPYNNWLSQCIADPDPIAVGERCLAVNNGLTNNPLVENRIALPFPYNGTVGFCARLWFSTFPGGSNDRPCIVFSTAAAAALGCLKVEQNGALSLYSAINGALIATTVVPVISTNSWNHVEVTYNGTTGAMEAYLNGVPILSGVSANLGTTGFLHTCTRDGTGVGQVMRVKDMVIWDGTGTRNNSIMGTVICRRFKPNSDVTLGGWACSTGVDGYPLLAKDAPNDATYLSADDAPPAPMQYGMENLPPDVTSVRAILSVARVRKIDGGDANVQVSLISNGDFDNGADRPITTTFTYYFDVSELSPDTAAPWTPVEFDAMTTQVDRTI